MDRRGDNEVKYIPVCDDDVRPARGRWFSTLAEAEGFYRRYGGVVGFDCRCHSLKTVDGVNIWRYMVCSREGMKFVAECNKDDGFEDVENRRKRKSSRCGCTARVSFKFHASMGYVINDFVEEHNHPLVEPKYKQFMRVNRNMDDLHKKFVLDCAKVSIGPTHAHKLLGELLGGVHNVGCTIVDVRNFSRDMKVFVEGSDAQMLLNEMKRKKELWDGFLYAYEVDEEQRLNRLFWCDPISRCNYHMYGDVVSFDTTYSTNKYCMIFAPFTGKDNHGRPVTFAAGLLNKEDANSFSWIFSKFFEFMGSMPSLLITDQDLGMKVAVERVLTGTRHRWCMWHIMLKIADKVPKGLHANELFKKEFNSCVWSELVEPDVFEDMWWGIMNKYDLVEDQWFANMFDSIKYWVPAFFRDHPMGGLLRTTSISESENSFFKRHTRSSANLIEFWMQFNNALDAQRHANDRLNYLDTTSLPTLLTKLDIEKHASLVYTFKIFGLVQVEIMSACFECSLIDLRVVDGFEEFVIKDGHNREYVVLHDMGVRTFVCGCKMFSRVGLLCCHIIFVLKNKRINDIPDMYLSGRWLKISCAKPIPVAGRGDVGGYMAIDEKKKISNDLMCSFFGWHRKFEGDIEKMRLFMTSMNDAGKCIAGSQALHPDEDRNHIFEKFYGGPLPDEVDILPPRVVKTKGSGSRLVSRKEKALRDLNKPLRKCAKCKQLAHHDSRNCDKVTKSKRLGQ